MYSKRTLFDNIHYALCVGVSRFDYSLKSLVIGSTRVDLGVNKIVTSHSHMHSNARTCVYVLNIFII